MMIHRGKSIRVPRMGSRPPLGKTSAEAAAVTEVNSEILKGCAAKTACSFLSSSWELVMLSMSFEIESDATVKHSS